MQLFRKEFQLTTLIQAVEAQKFIRKIVCQMSKNCFFFLNGIFSDEI